MREIKFRAWSEDKRCMYFPELITNGMNKKSTSASHSREDGSLTIYFHQILMQYTGLKDKNGKEIYEGDIIRWDTKIWKIIYHPCFFGFCLQNQEHRYLMSDAINFAINKEEIGDMSEAIEVIGNIYENPELLGDDHE